MYQCYVVNTTAYTIELWIHLGGFLSTQEASVAPGYRLERLVQEKKKAGQESRTKKKKKQGISRICFCELEKDIFDIWIHGFAQIARIYVVHQFSVRHH